MKNKRKNWTKLELKIYLLLLCAKIDNDISEEEVTYIKSKTDVETFDSLYKEFIEDCEDDCFEKIEDAIGQHEYSPRELSELRMEIHEVFKSDEKILMKERNLERVFDNILY